MRSETNILYPLLDFWRTFVDHNADKPDGVVKLYDGGMPIQVAHSRQIGAGHDSVLESFPDLDVATLMDLKSEPGIFVNVLIASGPRSLPGAFLVAERSLSVSQSVRKTFFIMEGDVRSTLRMLSLQHHRPLPDKHDSIVVKQRQVGYQKVSLKFSENGDGLQFED